MCGRVTVYGFYIESDILMKFECSVLGSTFQGINFTQQEFTTHNELIYGGLLEPEIPMETEHSVWGSTFQDVNFTQQEFTTHNEPTYEGSLELKEDTEVCIGMVRKCFSAFHQWTGTCDC